jgi:hypothetical protein
MDGTDLHFYLSASGASEGGATSSTPIVDATDNNVFSDVSSSSRIAGGTEVRKIFMANEHATDAYAAHSIWISTAPTHCTGYIGLGFNDADDDELTAGNLVAFSGGAKVALISDGADTRAVDVYGLVGGVPTKETMTLTGSSEVLSSATFDSGLVYALHTTVSASRTVTVKQGTGGTTRGTIGIGKTNCFLWLTAASKSAGLRLPALVAGATEGIWEKVVWAAAAIASAQDLPLATEAL